MSDSPGADLTRAYTTHGSVLYVEESSGKLRHGPVARSPHNAFLAREGDRVRVLWLSGGVCRPLIVSPGSELVVSRDDEGAPVPALLELVDAGQAQFGLRSGSGFLSAEPGGRIALDRPHCLAWEQFWLLPRTESWRETEASGGTRLFLGLPEVALGARDLIGKGQYDDALQLIVRLIEGNFQQPEHTGHSLYLEELDSLLPLLSDRLMEERQVSFASPAADHVLIVATEMYLTGGHSRVIEDLCNFTGPTTIVLTDFFDGLSSGRLDLAFLAGRLGAASVVVLPRMSLVEKALNLARLAGAIGPKAIFFFTHHQDPIAYVGLAGGRIPYKRIFFHHTDHNPALGATAAGFIHVDCTRFMQGVCRQHLARPCIYLPLHVPDLGRRPKDLAEGQPFSTVTSGSANKFARQGELAYARIVATVLEAIDGAHHHIGGLPEDWLAEIREALRARGIAPERFVYLGMVPSLWGSLKTLGATVYLASAPLGGGRAAIEAQGCGYPAIFYAGSEMPPLLEVHKLYASDELSWTSFEELRQALARVRRDQSRLSEEARAYYVAEFGEAAYRAALSEITRAA